MGGMHEEGPRYIAVEGVIGAGKTSLATLLAEKLNARLVLERFEENPFLPLFYEDRQRYAFQTQMFFLLSRFRQLQELSQPELFQQIVVSDYMFQKDRIFASLTLDEQEYALYDTVVTALESQLPRPDLVIYLQSSIKRLVENIRKRRRAMEERISIGYLRDLSDAYTKFFFQYQGVPALIVNTRGADFLNDPQAMDELLQEISRPNDAPVRLFTYATDQTSSELGQL